MQFWVSHFQFHRLLIGFCRWTTFCDWTIFSVRMNLFLNVIPNEIWLAIQAWKLLQAFPDKIPHWRHVNSQGYSWQEIVFGFEHVSGLALLHEQKKYEKKYVCYRNYTTAPRWIIKWLSHNMIYWNKLKDNLVMRNFIKFH